MSHSNPVLDQYRNRRVFLTGHTGFKGAWLVHWLNRLGAQVRGYSLAPGAKDLYRTMDGDRLCESQIDDIRNVNALCESMQAFQPDYIFHLAAQSLVGESYERPLETFDVNVTGTANVLHAARQLKHPTSIVVVTTDKVYENLESGVAYAENDRLGGHDPYSASKACAEIVSDSFRKSFFPVADYSEHQTGLATARSGNVIGGGDWNKDHLMPDIVEALVNGNAIPVRNPTAVRPWQHVLEPLWGYLLLGARLMNDPSGISGAWNFGPTTDDAISVEELVRKAIEIWGSGSYQDESRDNAPHEANLLQIDSTKAGKKLLWQPTFDTGEAVHITLDWYRDFKLNSSDPNELINSDIDLIESRISAS